MACQLVQEAAALVALTDTGAEEEAEEDEEERVEEMTRAWWG